jgi:hypothetical protein
VNDELTAERIARNESLFRDANEQISTRADEFDVRDRVPFVCECATTTCTAVVRLSLDEYRAVRHDPRTFLTAPGHAATAGRWADVVERRPDYDVVRKVGLAGEIAEALDQSAVDLKD